MELYGMTAARGRYGRRPAAFCGNCGVPEEGELTGSPSVE
jgi:hypothetical protein